MHVVRCAPEVVAVVVAHARAEAPNECCGLLVGRGDTIVEAVPVANLASSPSRFEVDPAAHMRVRREARARGLAVVGVFHSHVDTAAQPSSRDVDEASYAEYLYGIVSLAGAQPDFRLFRLTDHAFEAVELVS